MLSTTDVHINVSDLGLTVKCNKVLFGVNCCAYFFSGSLFFHWPHRDSCDVNVFKFSLHAHLVMEPQKQTIEIQFGQLVHMFNDKASLQRKAPKDLQGKGHKHM